MIFHFTVLQINVQGDYFLDCVSLYMATRLPHRHVYNASPLFMDIGVHNCSSHILFRWWYSSPVLHRTHIHTLMGNCYHGEKLQFLPYTKHDMLKWVNSSTNARHSQRSLGYKKTSGPQVKKSNLLSIHPSNNARITSIGYRTNSQGKYAVICHLKLIQWSLVQKTTPTRDHLAYKTTPTRDHLAYKTTPTRDHLAYKTTPTRDHLAYKTTPTRDHLAYKTNQNIPNDHIAL